MKSAFKIILFFASLQLQAREVVLVENLATNEVGALLKNILVKKFNIPKELITLRNNQTSCSQKSDAIAHFCLLPDGDLKVIKMNEFVVKNSLGVFLNGEDN